MSKKSNKTTAKTKKKKITPGLGKGLGALLPSIEFRDKGFKVSSGDEDQQGQMAMIDVSAIHTNPYQPRQDFDPQALEDLKDSIVQHGIIQPITVRRDVKGYELIAGERRLKASNAAGLKKVPAYILDIDRGVEMLEIALIENVQREDLNPIEIAHGYQRLIEECRLKQEEVAAKVAKDRSTITNFLRLLKLPERIQESVRKKELSMGHARTLLGLSSKERMLVVWKEILEAGLTVRVTEKLVKDIENGLIIIDTDKEKKKLLKKVQKSKKFKLSPEVAAVIEDIEDRLRHVFGTQVKINTKTEKSGKIELEFYSKEDLERLLELFDVIEKNL